MNKIEELYNQITTTYKQKIFGKFLQTINDYKFLSFSKNVYCILYDSTSLINLLSIALCKKYIYKDIKLNIINFSSYNKRDLSFLLKENISYFKEKKSSYSISFFNDFFSLKERKDSLLVFQDTFDDEIVYIMYNLLNDGKLLSLNPIEKKKNYYITRPSLLIRNRDLLYIFNKYELENKEFSSLSFEKINKDRLYYIKDLIATLKQSQNQIEMNIFDAPNNVIVDKLLSYIKDDESFNFLDSFK